MFWVMVWTPLPGANLRECANFVPGNVMQRLSMRSITLWLLKCLEFIVLCESTVDSAIGAGLIFVQVLD